MTRIEQVEETAEKAQKQYATERFRPLAHYSEKVTGLTSSQFLEIHNHPVLLYSQSPDRLEDIGFQFETIVINCDSDQPLSLSAEAESHVTEIKVVEILKRASSTSIDMICVGRTTNNDIVFSNSSISKFHAYFLKAADGRSYEVVDADSTNGTRVNNQRLRAHQNHPLVNLDRIEFGNLIRTVYLTPRGFYEFLHDSTRSGVI